MLAKMPPDLWGWSWVSDVAREEQTVESTHPATTSTSNPKDEVFEMTVRLIVLTPSPFGAVIEICSIPRGLQRISWIASP